jgi:hypothetical protein
MKTSRPFVQAVELKAQVCAEKKVQSPITFASEPAHGCHI